MNRDTTHDILVRPCNQSDFDEIYEIINDAAQAYKGIIPADRWHEPYMPREELAHEIADGVVFWVLLQDDSINGLMGIQDKGDVVLIRHAYVRTNLRRGGIGTRLLRHLEKLTDKPILIGTWADAFWAVEFYQKNGYCLVTPQEKDYLLRKYWNIPQRQIETSVVLADQKWQQS